MKNEIKVGDLVMGESGTPSAGHAGIVYEIKYIGRHRYAFYRDDEGYVFMNLVHRLTKNVPEKGVFPRKNPSGSRGREIGSHPVQGRYTSFKKWADAVKSIGGRLRSESPVPQVVYGPFGFVSEWNGKSGKIEEFFDPNPVRRHKGETERKFISRCMSEEKESFPAPKQRIAVCLSKARKNPFNDRNLDA